MPIYEYWCESCGKEFEQMRPMSQASEPAKCPSCGAESEKLPSVFASKAEYTIKVPRSGAFRQRKAGGVQAAPAASPGASTGTSTP
jgi:putative FmdB family regulatory protein